MSKLIKIPHEVHESTCYLNGLYDVLTWRGARYDYFLLSIIGGMASFAYLKFKMAKPPCMVYWGNNSKYLLNDLSLIIGFSQTISEGKSFKNEFPKIKRYLDNNEPVVVGALDMYYLHYYPELYKKEHVPIHYLLVVGYDDEKQVVYVHDCSFGGMQQVSYIEFERSLNVNVSGMSKKNTYRTFRILQEMPTELEIAENGFAYKASRMLKPPVSMFGIPAMRKLAKDIITWEDKACYNHMVAYAGLTPPLVAEDLSHNDGLRFEQARVLKELGQKYQKKEWSEASNLFTKSGELIIRLCGKALNFDGDACSELLERIAVIEKEAYRYLSRK
ncbi:MAG: BtrH N-terminal domain-containing protein [Dehalococcoidales bacterium]|nr:BtrH N-terminal domain-containing protein [Dehalococcoidales bacterium]